VIDEPRLAEKYVKDGVSHSRPTLSRDLIELDSVFSLSALESKLVAYVKDEDAASEPFDVSSVPKVSREQAAQEVARTLWISLSVWRLTVS